MKKSSFILLLLSIIFLGSLPAQELPFVHYTQENESLNLPSAEIQSSYQDRLGYIWLAVYSSGLLRYNGHKTEIYQQAEGLPAPTVYQTLEDSLGRLWVATNAGLAVSERSLSDYRHKNDVRFSTQIGSTELVNTTIFQNRLCVDAQGRLWAGTTENGLIRYTFYGLDSLSADYIPTDLEEEGQNLGVRSLFARDNGNVWAGLKGGKIMVFLKGDLPYEQLGERQGVFCQTETMYETPDGELWGGCWNGSIWRLEKKNERRQFLLVNNRLKSKIHSITQSRNGTIWVGSNNSGALRIRRKSEEKELTPKILKQNNGLLSDNLNHLMEDREGNLWFAQSGGVSKLRPSYDAFINYSARSRFEEDPILPNVSLNAVLPTSGAKSPAGVWLGSGAGAIFISANGRRAKIQREQGLQDDRAHSLLEDAKGRIWIGTANGINCLAFKPQSPPFSPKNQSINILGRSASLAAFENHTVNSAKKLSTPRDLNLDREVESLWFPAYQHLFCLINEEWYIFQASSGLPNTSYNAVAYDSEGKLWVGTQDRGVYRTKEALTLQRMRQLSGKSALSPFGNQDHVFGKEITEPIFELIWDESKGAPSNEIESLFWQESEEQMWVGTINGLVVLQNNSLEIIAHLTSANGLKADNITGMAFSSLSGSLWVGTNKGLAEIDLHTKEAIRTLTRQNGLVDDEVWYYGSVAVDQKGAVYFGTAKGLSIYRPWFDQAGRASANLQLGRADFTEDRRGNNEIDFEYAALSFVNEKQSLYKTRLIGFDKDWSEASAEVKIRYTNLPAFLTPRKYVFEVMAKVNDQEWTLAPLQYEFSVRPAWWLQWQAISAQFLLLAGLIFGYLRYKSNIQAKELARERQISMRLQQLDKLKDQFLANTSHELRTPLNGIIGLAEALYDRSENIQDQEDLSLLMASGKRLTNLVNDILDFSKMKTHSLNLQKKPLDVRIFMDLVLKFSESYLAGKKVSLHNEIPVDLPAAEADENRLQQILQNLIDNAIKFTPEGSVRAHGRKNKDMLEISISDTGVGIPEDKKEAIFQSFEQVDASAGRMHGGAGLGLAITKQLVELHGGKIWVESAEGQGTTFTFTLPVSEKQAEPLTLNALSLAKVQLGRQVGATLGYRATTNGNSQKDVHILVVDDEPVNQRVLANHLGQAGYRVMQAFNGEQALQFLEGDQSFDLVLLDIMMPRMSGYEVCQKIRETHLPSQLPIIMITAKNQVQDLVQGLDLGANDYLAKPFSKDEFMARVKTHLNLHRINQATGKFVPYEFIRSLGRESITDVRLGDQVQREVTVLFSDIRSYTSLSESMTPEENFLFLNAYLKRIGPVIEKHQGFVNQFYGDGVMALFLHSPADALSAAIDMQKTIAAYNLQRLKQDRRPIKIGIGIHNGPLIMGILGGEYRLGANVVADTVNTSARMEGLTKYYGANILLSDSCVSKIADLNQFDLRYLGKVQVKGKKRPVGVYECFGGDESAILWKKQQTLSSFQLGLEYFFTSHFNEAERTLQKILDVNPEDATAKLFLQKIKAFIVSGGPEGWDGVETMETK